MALHSRRDVLGLGSAAAATALAGCTDWQFARRPDLTLTFINRLPGTARFRIELVRADRDEASEATVLSTEYEVPGTEAEAENSHTDENVVPSRPYLVRVEAVGEGESHARRHYHFYPDCTGGDEPPEELYVEFVPGEQAPGDDAGIEFLQNGCSTDAILL